MEPSQNFRVKSCGHLVLSCLGGGYSENMFLGNQLYVATMIKNTLREVYPYLNFSETLSIIDVFGELKKVIPYKTTYDALNHINALFFPMLNRYKKSFSDKEKLRLKKLDIYSGRRNLAERVESIPEELEEKFREGIIHPSPVMNMKTRVPKYKKRGKGGIYAQIRAREISNIINTFPIEHFHGFN